MIKKEKKKIHFKELLLKQSQQRSDTILTEGDKQDAEDKRQVLKCACDEPGLVREDNVQQCSSRCIQFNPHSRDMCISAVVGEGRKRVWVFVGCFGVCLLFNRTVLT